MASVLVAEILIKQGLDTMKVIEAFEELGYIVLQDLNEQKLLVVENNGNKKHSGIGKEKHGETQKDRVDREYQKLVKQGRPISNNVDAT